MKTAKKAMSLFLAVVMVAALLVGCGQKQETPVTPPEETAEPTYKDTLTVAIKAEPSSLDPQGTNEMVSFAIQMQLFDTLVRKTASGEIVPCLAEKWERIDDLTIRFYLRDDAKFSDGTPVTAEDVVFTMQRAEVNPTSASIMGSFDGANCKVVDEHTVDIATHTPFSSILNYLASSRGNIVSKVAVESMGETDYGRAPIGSGAMKFESWENGTKVVLTRNENYWGEPTSYDKLVFRFITETAGRAMELEAGTVDLVYDPGTSDCARLRDDPAFALYATEGYGMMQIYFGHNDPVMQDINVRKALAHALDIPAITKAIYGDFATPANGQYANPISNFKDCGVYAYDVELAKQAIKDAGYENGLTLYVSINESQDINDLAVMAQDYWSKIGITADIHISAQSEWLAGLRRGDPQVSPTFGTITTGDAGHAMNMCNGTVEHMTHLHDEHASELYAAAMGEFDDAKRDEIFKELQQYCSDQYVQIPIATKQMLYLASAKVEGFECDPGGIPFLGSVKVAE